jgi:hypothetical protein
MAILEMATIHEGLSHLSQKVIINQNLFIILKDTDIWQPE